MSAMYTAPVRAPFFDAEVRIEQQNPNLPPKRLAVSFLRTTREWASWVANIASAVGAPIEALTVAVTMNFPNIVAGGTADLVVPLAGVLANDLVPAVTVTPQAGVDAGLVFHGFVSGNDEVTVRATNASTGAINPVAFDFRIEVRRYA